MAIPPQFHRIWVGGKEIPPEHLQWIEDCRRLHPNWRQRLWRDAELERLVPDSLRPVWDKANPVQKSDIGGYLLVYEHGGVYLDTDYRWCQSIEPFLWGCDAFCVQTDGGRISASVFGAIRHHPAWRRLLTLLPERFRADEQLSTSTPLITEVMRSFPTVRKLERRAFIPISWGDRARLRTQRDFPWSVAVHQFAASWLAGGAAGG